MANIYAWLVAVAAIGSFSACGSDDDETGSRECCRVRAICEYCTCSETQELVGLQDTKRSCEIVLEAWDGIGCISCQDSFCLNLCAEN